MNAPAMAPAAAPMRARSKDGRSLRIGPREVERGA